MSTSFQTCPGCDSFILSDTFECPECGHVFDDTRAKAAAAVEQDMKNQSMYDTCRKCGESVRSGLVRCWNCNSFMRKDVEARYQQMQASPQHIIFSDIPKDQRTELLEKRSHGTGYISRALDAQDDSEFEFTLRDVSDDGDFELNTGDGATPSAAPSDVAPAKPAASQNAAQATPDSADSTADEAADAQAAESAKQAAAEEKKAQEDLGVDDLVGIALQDQREDLRRKKQKVEEARSRRILLPCTRCGAWIRVNEDQSGHTLRCRQCKFPFVVPLLKKQKKGGPKGQQAAAPQIKVTWVNDVQLHVVLPTDVVLKPGSLQKTSEPVDAAFHESGLYLQKFAPPAKKSLFGKADGPPETEEQRQQVRDHIAKTGAIADLPFGELHKVAAENVGKVRLIQPVAEAHESMFAGVPVFGEGRIAVYLPLELPEQKQAFLSFTLTEYRRFSAPLQEMFGLALKAEHNGVPAAEVHDTLKCHLSEMPIQSLKDLVYYENDPGYELDVAGYICSTCGIAITEESRARKKLGGSSAKGIGKAKCPACSNKFGDRKAMKIVKSPSDEKALEEVEDVSEVLRPKKAPAVADAAKPAKDKDPAVTSAVLQGQWKMISIAENGNFESPNDVSAAGIVFAIDGEKYTVSAGGTVQEQGKLILDTSQKPVLMDQKISEGPDAGKSHLGIVRIVDGKLQNCQAAFDEARPENFDSQPNSRNTLAVFERS